jgi:hypothetical protein
MTPNARIMAETSKIPCSLYVSMLKVWNFYLFEDGPGFGFGASE